VGTARTTDDGDRRGPGGDRPRRARNAHIVHLTAEYWPYIRTGGLGEAVRGLATFQSRAGTNASVILPLYEPIKEGDYGLQPVGDPFQVQVGPRWESARVWEAKRGSDGPRVFLIENVEYFGRRGVYGEGGSDYPDIRRWPSCISGRCAGATPSLILWLRCSRCTMEGSTGTFPRGSFPRSACPWSSTVSMPWSGTAGPIS